MGFIKIDMKGSNFAYMRTFIKGVFLPVYGYVPVHNIRHVKLLQMNDEEVERLYDQGGMTERGSAEQFGQAWLPDEESV